MAWLNRLRLRLASPVASPFELRRSFGSAAAVPLDYDYDYDSDSDDDNYYRDDLSRLGLAGSEPERGVQWVLMGAPGSWRHAFADRLSKLLQVPHISMGTLVRQELSPRSSLYKEIASAVNERKLVPEGVVFALLSKRLEEGHAEGETGFILEGIPRTCIQAEILDQIADIDLVVNLKYSEEHLVKLDPGSETASLHQEFLGSMSPSAVPIKAGKKSLRTYAEEFEEQSYDDYKK